MIPKWLLTILIGLSALSILLCDLSIVDTMVSLKYGTATNDCVSDITGSNLDQTLWLWRSRGSGLGNGPRNTQSVR